MSIFFANSVPRKSESSLQKWLSIYLSDSGETFIPSLDRFAWSVSVATIVLVGSLSYFVYQSHPHIPDETQYLFQAKYMAAGQLTVSASRTSGIQHVHGSISG